MKRILLGLSFIVLFIVGCTNTMNTPTKRVEELLGKYQKLDSAVLAQLDNVIAEDTTMTDEQKKEYRSLMEKQYQNLSYKIKGEEITGDDASVDVEIEVLDYATSINESRKYYSEHRDEFKDEDIFYCLGSGPNFGLSFKLAMTMLMEGAVKHACPVYSAEFRHGLIERAEKDVPIIFLTSRTDSMDELSGMLQGGDDYITKPFSIGALQRKISAMFAMLDHHQPAKDIYDDGKLFLDFSEQAASLNGKPLTLSPMEFKMLNLFRKNPKQVLTRGQLLEKLWDVDENYVDEHTLTTTVSRIRSKIEADGGRYIKTIYGMGYQWMGGEAR